MFTRNFDNLMMRFMGYINTTTPTQTTWENGTNCGYKTFNGTFRANGLNNGGDFLMSYTALKISIASNSPSAGTSVYMVLGTGTAEEDYNDYTITKDTELTMNSYTGTQEIDNNGNLIITDSKIVTNNTANDITISEIGIVSSIKYASGNYDTVLLYRKKLVTPVVVSANGGVQSFELKFTNPRPNMPSAN